MKFIVAKGAKNVSCLCARLWGVLQCLVSYCIDGLDSRSWPHYENADVGFRIYKNRQMTLYLWINPISHRKIFDIFPSKERKYTASLEEIMKNTKQWYNKLKLLLKEIIIIIHFSMSVNSFTLKVKAVKDMYIFSYRALIKFQTFLLKWDPIEQELLISSGVQSDCEWGEVTYICYIIGLAI